MRQIVIILGMIILGASIAHADMRIAFYDGNDALIRDKVLTAEEVKALETNMVSIPEWLINAIEVKSNRVVNTIVQKHSDKQPEKMDKADRLAIIKDLTLESAVDYNARALND